VLELGGGDGLAVREILKYPSVEEIFLVDLDSAMTNLFSKHPALTTLNQNSLTSSKVRIINEDAFLWLRENKIKFDFIAVDFPDPSNFSVGKLYTNTFYKLLKEQLHENGVGIIQSTSPYVAKKSFWCIDNTLKSVGFLTAPYHVYVPAFGDWGYIMISKAPIELGYQYPSGLKFLNSEIAKTLFVFPEDMKILSHDINKLNNQILVRNFEEEWSGYVH
jgi:spermidine synthase